jgi:steroid delta-isomerase-like uncharacterized protein
MTRDEVAAFMARRQQRYDARDAAGLAADYAEDAVIHSPMAGSHTGRKAARQAIEAMFNAFPDWKITPEMVLIDGDRVVNIVTIEGTHQGMFMGLPPSGKHFRSTAALLYELRDRKIAAERRIYDFTGLLVQVGVLKAKPA